MSILTIIPRVCCLKHSETGLYCFGRISLNSIIGMTWAPAWPVTQRRSNNWRQEVCEYGSTWMRFYYCFAACDGSATDQMGIFPEYALDAFLTPGQGSLA